MPKEIILFLTKFHFGGTELLLPPQLKTLYMCMVVYFMVGTCITKYIKDFV